jgi:hypothetical protein
LDKKILHTMSTYSKIYVASVLFCVQSGTEE